MAVTALPKKETLDYDLKLAMHTRKLNGLWRLMTGFRSTYFGAAASLGVATIARTATFLLLAYFIDTYLTEQEHAVSLAMIVAGFIGLAVVQGIFTFMSGRMAAATAEGIVLRLRNYLQDQIQRLSFTYHDKTQTGELIQRATSDVDTIRRFFSEQAIESGRILMLFLVNFAAILTIDVRLAFFSVIVIPVVLVISFFFFRRVSTLYELYQEQEAKLSSTLQENLSGVRVVKAFARQEFEEGKFEEVNWEKYTRGKKLLIAHALYWPITDIMCGLQMIAGFGLGAIMAINGTISVGQYLAYSGMIIWIIWPIRNLGRLIVQMSEALVSFGRVSEIINQDRERLDVPGFVAPATLRGEVTYDNVSFAYRESDTMVLRNVSFHAAAGQRIALLGATGSGKTSLVNLLPRFYDYTDGRILLDGKELTAYSAGYLRQHIGIVEQEPFLFSRSIRDNITFGVGRDVSEEEIEAAARAAAVHDVIVAKFPEGYNTLVGERGVTLSGGQKQRVAIARTLLKDPRILIMDDSTSAVDTETEAMIRGALETLMQGRTTFIIAHRIQSLMSADRILVLEKGRVVQQGTHAELMDQPGMYRRIYDAQTRIESELQEELNRVRV